MRVDNPETFFLAVSLLDNYLIAKSKRGIPISSDNLYLVGMASVFIASKYEDVVPIFMKQILDDVGHFKFTRTHILSMEREILSALGFKVCNTTYNSYHESSLILAELHINDKEVLAKAKGYLTFINYLVVYIHQLGFY